MSKIIEKNIDNPSLWKEEESINGLGDYDGKNHIELVTGNNFFNEPKNEVEELCNYFKKIANDSTIRQPNTVLILNQLSKIFNEKDFLKAINHKVLEIYSSDKKIAYSFYDKMLTIFCNFNKPEDNVKTNLFNTLEFLIIKGADVNQHLGNAQNSLSYILSKFLNSRLMQSNFGGKLTNLISAGTKHINGDNIMEAAKSNNKAISGAVFEFVEDFELKKIRTIIKECNHEVTRVLLENLAKKNKSLDRLAYADLLVYHQGLFDDFESLYDKNKLERELIFVNKTNKSLKL